MTGEGDSKPSVAATAATGGSGRDKTGRDRPRVVTEESLAELALGPLLDDLLVRIRDALAADTVVILLAEPGEAELYAAAVLDFEEEIAERVRVPIGRGFAGRVAATGQPVVIEDLDRADAVNHLLRKRGLKSLLGVPLVLDGDVVGVLHVGSLVPRVFGPPDIEVLEGIGERIALAIDRARAHQAERRAHQRAERLQAVTARLATARTQRDVADVLVREGVAALGAAAGWVALLGPGGRQLEMVAAIGYPSEVVERYRSIPVESAIGAQDILERGEASWLESAEDVLARFPQHADPYVRMGYEALAVVPLEAGGARTGLVALNFGERTRFGDSERGLLLAVASQCSQALERARLHDALAERANAAVVLAHVDDGVFQVGADGAVRYWNPAAAHLTGIPAEAAVGRSVAALLGGWEEASSAIEVGTRPGAATAGEAVPLVVRGEERWLAVSGVRTPDGTVYAFRDLTSERALERARRDFLATASHELRTPLGAVYGASLTLLNRDLEEEQRDAMLDMVVRECERLTRIVEDLLLANDLDLDHVHVLLGSADAAALAQEVLSVRGANLPEGLTLAVEADVGAVEVACDPERLRQVLLNLVDNAVKYSPNGGAVRLAVTADDLFARFVVTDEGIGIPAGEQRRIFEKFYRLDPELRRGVGGSGLGLYISRELVRRMDGRIEVESEPGRGSRFVVELPLAR